MGKGKGYRTFTVGGYEVLVGKGSRDNDELTFDVAAGPDVWLHTGGETPGSHVVVRNPSGGEVPREVVEGAAALAAWYSKARGAPFVKVDWCRRSDVFKPRGAPAGLVELKRHKTIKVKPGLPAGSRDDDG
jgi:predicted ribosome quality control (RQC) complex YloA/Tae2 family protein